MLLLSYDLLCNIIEDLTFVSSNLMFLLFYYLLCNNIEALTLVSDIFMSLFFIIYYLIILMILHM